MSKASNPFLRNGYMGMCVFLFKMYEFTSDKKYYQLAQEILTRTCDLLKKGSKVDMIDGLSGIACQEANSVKKLQFITTAQEY